MFQFVIIFIMSLLKNECHNNTKRQYNIINFEKNCENYGILIMKSQTSAIWVFFLIQESCDSRWSPVRTTPDSGWPQWWPQDSQWSYNEWGWVLTTPSHMDAPVSCVRLPGTHSLCRTSSALPWTTSTLWRRSTGDCGWLHHVIIIHCVLNKFIFSWTHHI